MICKQSILKPWFLDIYGFYLKSKLLAIVGSRFMSVGITMLHNRIWIEEWVNEENNKD